MKEPAMHLFSEFFLFFGAIFVAIWFSDKISPNSNTGTLVIGLLFVILGILSRIQFSD